ncbi:TonB-dependent receptor [Burkholderiaceae bacterium DAT-1]|nr:TonB-dependent receptor [Burkholderiaceae bacterium DAT-1]
MSRTFVMRQLPFAIATLLATSTSFVHADAQATADTASDAQSEAQANAHAGISRVEKIELVSKRLKSAQNDLSPKVGTTVYTVDKHMIEQMGQGESTPFNEVLARLPGIDQDSKASGSVHVRDDHGNVQYRLDGILLPENISGFGQAIDTRLVERFDFLTGALPAQYGLRAAGVVDIQTKAGSFVPGGQVGMQFGSHGYTEPSVEMFGGGEQYRYFLSASRMQSDLGIENPQPTRSALHDRTVQNKVFGNASWFVDESTRVGLMFGSYNGRFQIPNNPGQEAAWQVSGAAVPASSALDQNQFERNRYVLASLQQQLNGVDYQLAAFSQFSDLHYVPDAVGDLAYTGVASDSTRSNSASGLQFDMSTPLNEQHTLRAGLVYTRQYTKSDNTVRVFAVDESGAQSSSTPLTIIDNTSKTGTLGSLYVQDEWHVLEPLTINYGLRFDRVSAFIQEQQLSPRLNAAWKFSDSTSIHAGYARYFTPPAQQLAAQSSIDKFVGTSNAPEAPHSDQVKAERTHYYDIGISHHFNDAFSVSVDGYYKDIRNLLDEGQFGQALILSPFNFEKGSAKGIETAFLYEQKNWGGYLNLSWQKATARNIISGQALIEAEELEYIAHHDVFLDHDQTWTVSTGAHYRMGDALFSMDILHGSGLRRTPEGGTPNSSTLPAYTTANFASAWHWHNVSGIKEIEARVALINAFDKRYLLRDGTGVGVGAPQHGTPRTVFAGISMRF